MLHASIRWPDTPVVELWTMALEHDAHLNNTILIYGSSITEVGQEGFSPMEICSEDTEPCKDENIHPICCSRVWVCPTYFLDPVICDGENIPKWMPISH